MSVHSLSRSPSPQAEFAHQWWVDRLHNRRCDYCEDWVPISGVNTSASGIYCSEFCWHANESTIAYRMGEV